MTTANVCRKVPGQNRKAQTNSLILLAAMSLRGAFPQSPAKPRRVQCFQAGKAPQSYGRKVHPYGGQPGVPPPMGSGLPPRCFGVASKAEFNAQQARQSRIGDIPYRCVSAVLA